jgi:hypothetical protein
MNDFIPTTADVRDAYSSESSDSTYANRMFDLWLAKYKAKIIAKTEERIIKVIEGYLHHDYLTGQNEDEMLDELYLSELITLIKGEK